MTNVKVIRTIMPFLVVIVFLAGGQLASATVDYGLQAGKYLTIEAVNASRDAEGFLIEGDLARMHFSPRRMLPGKVVVSVLDQDGAVLGRTTLDTRPGFVPKGLRSARFAGRIDGVFPAGARLVLRPVD